MSILCKSEQREETPEYKRLLFKYTYFPLIYITLIAVYISLGLLNIIMSG